jgi:Uma2 family endonuclease
MIEGPIPVAHLMTAEQLLQNDIPHKSTELVRGQLIVREPPGTYHGQISARLLIELGTYVKTHQLGEVFGQDTGFKIESNPDTVRAPDVAFITRDRLPLVTRRGYSALAPDLIAEVLSPDDRPGQVTENIGEWLRAGVRLAWVLDPEQRTARLHRPDGSVSLIEPDGALDGESVLPGFRCALADLYRER